MIKHKIITGWILPIKGYAATTIYPFIFVRKDLSQKSLRHEKIHLIQQVEMLLIFFYLAYGLNYIINLFVYDSRKEAYRNICFEREANNNEKDPNYLTTRKPFSWIKFI